MDEPSVRKWVERARAGDSDAFAALFKQYRPDVERLCTRLLASKTDAEDAASETFLRSHRALESFDRSKPFRKWLLAIAAHHCVDLLRRRTTERRIFDPADLDPAQLEGPGPTPLHHRLREEARLQVLDGLAALPDRYRAPLVLRYYAEFDYDGIAEVLEVTRNQVATLLFRAKRRLRDQFESESRSEPAAVIPIAPREPKR